MSSAGWDPSSSAKRRSERRRLALRQRAYRRDRYRQSPSRPPQYLRSLQVVRSCDTSPGESRDIAQADFTSLAEVSTGRAGSRIERNEAGVEGSFKQSATAGLGSWPLWD